MQLICKDCRFFLESDQGVVFAKCKATETLNLVTGEPEYSYCSIERNSTSPARCGTAGRNFELNMELEEINHGE
jgi:hypothetical protein